MACRRPQGNGDVCQVSRGTTGHAEAICVTYDPSVITYDQLLMVFFDAHDPTQLNRQGPDMGTSIVRRFSTTAMGKKRPRPDATR